jgi:hypothetical protein
VLLDAPAHIFVSGFRRRHKEDFAAAFGSQFLGKTALTRPGAAGY